MDEADIASEQEEAFRAEALRRFRTIHFKPMGRCRNCLEPVAGQELYCDIDCRRDHERELKFQQHTQGQQQ